jgi:virginiamycin B lyase
MHAPTRTHPGLTALVCLVAATCALAAALETDGKFTEYALPNPASGPTTISIAPDGNLWFTEGMIAEFDLPRTPGGPGDITTGADGNLWFVELNANRVARITTGGKVTEFQIPSPAGSPINIAVGPDRNIWYTKQSKLGRVTPDGVITEFEIPTPNGGATGLTAGSDRQPPDRLTNKLWFTESGGNKIAFLNFK